jgi:hypothetical protein
MTLPIYRNGEALFTVILRHPEAKNLLSKWINTSRSINARVDDNRMFIFDHNTLSRFIVTWANGWENILVWDPLLKRHITF